MPAYARADYLDRCAGICSARDSDTSVTYPPGKTPTSVMESPKKTMRMAGAACVSAGSGSVFLTGAAAGQDQGKQRQKECWSVNGITHEMIMFLKKEGLIYQNNRRGGRPPEPPNRKRCHTAFYPLLPLQVHPNILAPRIKIELCQKLLNLTWSGTPGNTPY